MPKVRRGTRGRKKQRARSRAEAEISEREKQQTPRCFVLKRGVVGDRVQALVKDFRLVMQPNTSLKLKETRMNRMEDFTAVAGNFNVTHLVIFTATKLATWVKIAKLPQGPTLTFKVESFSLMSDIRAAQKKPRSPGPREYASAPLQVLNGFSGQHGGKGIQNLTSEMLRGLFPPIDVATFNQAQCQRTVLFNHDGGEKDTIQFRHFSLHRQPCGIQRGVSKLLKPSRVPKMGRLGDIADFVLGGGTGASESEMDEAQEVPIMDGKGRTAVKLVESGPRLTLLLVKAEEGVCGGGVLYHRWKTKTPSQIEVLQENARQRRKLKERNAKLEGKFSALKAKQKEANKRKRVQDVRGDGEEEEPLAVGDPLPAAAKGAPAAKKKRFHPFAWGAKAARRTAKGDKNTVKVNSSTGGAR